MRKLLLLTMLSVVGWACNAQFIDVPLPPRPTLPLSVSAVPIAQVRSFVVAADTFRAVAGRRIDALSREIQAYQARVDAGDSLTTYDTAQLKRLRADLDNTRVALHEATAGYDQLRAILPPRYRRHVVDWDGLVQAFTEYENDLQRRGGKLFLVGTALGFIGGFLLFH